MHAQFRMITALLICLAVALTSPAYGQVITLPNPDPSWPNDAVQLNLEAPTNYSYADTTSGCAANNGTVSGTSAGAFVYAPPPLAIHAFGITDGTTWSGVAVTSNPFTTTFTVGQFPPPGPLTVFTQGDQFTYEFSQSGTVITETLTDLEEFTGPNYGKPEGSGTIKTTYTSTYDTASGIQTVTYSGTDNRTFFDSSGCTYANSATTSGTASYNWLGSTPPTPPTIASTLPAGTAGQPYPPTGQTAQLISGGTPPYTVSATGLPPGLTANSDGTVSGTPMSTDSGTYTVTVSVTDAARETAGPTPVSIVIAPAKSPTPPVTSQQPVQDLGPVPVGVPTGPYTVAALFSTSVSGDNWVITTTPYDTLTIANGFSVRADSCNGVELLGASGNSCSIQINFTPTFIGTLTGVYTATAVNVENPALVSVFTFPIQGEGITPKLSMNIKDEAALEAAKDFALAASYAELAELVEPVNPKVAEELLVESGQATTEALAQLVIVGDPLDMNFEEIVMPARVDRSEIRAPRELTPKEYRAYLALTVTQQKIDNLTAAMLTAMNRSAGAASVNNTAWIIRQRQAAGLWATLIAEHLNKEVQLLGDFEDALVEGHTPAFTADASDVLAFQAAVSQNGLPADLRNTLSRRGLSQSEIAQATTAIATATPTAISFPDVLTDPTYLSMLSSSANNYTQFGRALPPLADVNHDGTVGCDDFMIVKAALGTRTGESGFNAAADIDGDGVVSLKDLRLVRLSLPAGTKCSRDAPEGDAE